MSRLLQIPTLWLGLLGLLSLALVIIGIPLFKQGRQKWQWGILLSFSLIASTLYTYLGASKDVVHLAALQKITRTLDTLSKKEALTPAYALAELKKLGDELKFSHAALARLGGIYIELGSFEEAKFAFKEAIKLAPNVSGYWEQWIYSYSLLFQGKLPEEVQRIALGMVESDPSQKAILNLLAIDDYFHERYALAMKRWQDLLETDESLTDERRAVLEKAIILAKQHL